MTPTGAFLVSLGGTALVALIGVSVSGRIVGPVVDQRTRSGGEGAEQ
jgi:hypothetical protein